MDDQKTPTELTTRKDQKEFLTETRFSDLDLPQKVTAGINDAGFTRCTPIQEVVFPVALKGGDVAGQAQTGTGKTAAFLVSIFTRLLELGEPGSKLPQALIVAPTRELALQINSDAKMLGSHTGFTTAVIIGGIDYKKQADTLRKGVDIVICTPGRIIDYYKQKIFKTDNIKHLVIDEADRLLDLGFAKDMRYILSKLPRYDKRQSMLFSATLSYSVLELTYDYMNMPEFVAVTPEEVTTDSIKQALFHVGADEKLSLLLGILEQEKWHRLLIFSNTKFMVEWLAAKLKGNGWPVEGITGDLPQRKRLRLMEGFKSGRIKILVATDVASRGIHVEDISHVINYDLPQDAENYIHRIGRTARAGKTGHAISMACEKYVFHLEAIEDLIGAKIPVEWPADDAFVEDKCGPVTSIYARRKKKTVRKRGRRVEKTAPPKRSRVSRNIPRSNFPGEFFGFGPITDPAEPKKNRPRRRRKKTTQKPVQRQKKQHPPKKPNRP